MVRRIVYLVLATTAAGCGQSTRITDHPVTHEARPVLTTAASEEGPCRCGRLAGVDAEPGRQSRPTAQHDERLRSKRRTTQVRVNPPGTYAQTGGIDGGQLVLGDHPGRALEAAQRYDLAHSRG